MNSKIGTILLNWNNSDDTIACCSMLRQSDYAQELLNIYIVDNCSEKAEYVKLAACEKEILLPQARNLGFAAGNNVGIRRAIEDGCDYFLIINTDVVFGPDLLPVLLRSFESAAQGTENLGVVSPKILYEKPSGMVWYAGGKNLFLSIGTMIGQGQIDHGQFDQKREVDFAVGCCMLVKKKVFDQVGLLDEKFFFYHEDVDFSRRTRGAGFSILYVPQTVLIHRVSQSTRNDVPRRYFLSASARVYFFHKHTPRWALPLQVCAEFYRFMRVALLAFSSHNVSLLEAYAQGIANGLGYRKK